LAYYNAGIETEPFLIDVIACSDIFPRTKSRPDSIRKQFPLSVTIIS